MEFYSNRGPNFEVWQQKDDGTFETLTVPIVGTYIGTLKGVPGSTVSALRFDSGIVYYRATFEDGSEWWSNGYATRMSCNAARNAESRQDCSAPALKYPTFVAPAGGAGSNIYGAELGIDLPYHQFSGVHDKDVLSALSVIEYSVNSMNTLYLKEAGIKHEIGRVILRASAAQDPYFAERLPTPPCASTNSCVAGQNNYARLDVLTDQWNNILPGPKTHNLALVYNNFNAYDGFGGGVANLGQVGNPRGYSSNDSDRVSDLSIVGRHELGHNWGVVHYEGNAPEGDTFMSNNNLNAMSGPEQKVVLDLRNNNIASFRNLGPLTRIMPPHASLDSTRVTMNDTVIDVLANDHDANGDSISLVEVDSKSYLGATVELVRGGGADGRDAVKYYSGKLSLEQQVDRFEYRIRDSSGLESVSYAYVKVGDFGGTFRQNFDSFPDGTTEFSDGSTAQGVSDFGSSKLGTASGALQLTPDEIYQLGSYTVPKLNLQDGFSASFKVKISSETFLSADAFAVNFGDPAPNKPRKRNNYGGYEKGLTVEFNTYSDKGFRVFVDDQEIPNNFVSDTTLADGQWRDVQVEWLAPGSLTLTVNGNKIFENLDTASFAPDQEDQISFSAQTRGYSHQVLLDDVVVSNLFGVDTKTTYDGRQYELVGTAMTWSDAAAYAKSKGASLVKIESLEQNQWLQSYLTKVNTTANDGGGAVYSWLGGTDSVEEGAWLWQDGTAVPANSSGTTWWGAGPGHAGGGSEPDNFGGSQHCLAIGLAGWPVASPGFYGSAGQWNDVNCSNKLRFAIQYPDNSSPLVSIVGGSRTVPDTDNKAGETIDISATASDSDGVITSTQWLVNGNEVATGLNASIAFPNGSTVVTFKAVDDGGAASTTTATITVPIPDYKPSDQWPAPYNGVTPNTSLGLSYNNIGSYDASDPNIYTCLKVLTNGEPTSVGGTSQYDIVLRVLSLEEGTVQITQLREFNAIGALNEYAELPDCSGRFETTTAVFTDVLQSKLYSNFLGNLLPDIKIFNVIFNLIDGDNLILKLNSFEEIKSN